MEMIDSSVRSPGEVESITFKSVLIRNFFVMDRFSENFEVHIATVHKSVPNKKFPNFQKYISPLIHTCNRGGPSYIQAPLAGPRM